MERKTIEERPARVTPHHFHKETDHGIEEDQEPEDLTVKGFLLLPPFQKEKEGQVTPCLVELNGVEEDMKGS